MFRRPWRRRATVERLDRARPESGRAICGDTVPAEWDRAATSAALLAGRARYLPWTDRAGAFDEFFWGEARRRLATDDITAIVNRQAIKLAQPAIVDHYGRFCAAVTAAALLQLDEPLRPERGGGGADPLLLADRGASRGSGRLDRRTASSWPGGQPAGLAWLRLPAADPVAQRQCRELPRPRCVLVGDAGSAERNSGIDDLGLQAGPAGRTARTRGGGAD